MDLSASNNSRLSAAINAALEREPQKTGSKAKKQSKYRNIKTEMDGVVFDSRREAAYYSALLFRRRAGEISDIKLQPKFPILINGKHVTDVVLDFTYRDVSGGKVHYIDVKGFANPHSKLKKKMVEAAYGIEVEWIK